MSYNPVGSGANAPPKEYPPIRQGLSVDSAEFTPSSEVGSGHSSFWGSVGGGFSSAGSYGAEGRGPSSWNSSPHWSGQSMGGSPYLPRQVEVLSSPPPSLHGFGSNPSPTVQKTQGWAQQSLNLSPASQIVATSVFNSGPNKSPTVQKTGEELAPNLLTASKSPAVASASSSGPAKPPKVQNTQVSAVPASGVSYAQAAKETEDSDGEQHLATEEERETDPSTQKKFFFQEGYEDLEGLYKYPYLNNSNYLFVREPKLPIRKIETLLNETNGIFFELPPGKVSRDGKITVQPVEKNGASFFYAMKRILTDTQIRSVHGVACSAYRKDLARSLELPESLFSIQTICHCADLLGKAVKGDPKAASEAENVLKEFEKLRRERKIELQDEKIRAEARKDLREDAAMYFLEKYCGIKVATAAFFALKQSMSAGALKETPPEDSELEDAVNQNISVLVPIIPRLITRSAEWYLMYEMANRHGLMPIYFNKLDHFSGLIEGLKSKGPLLVVGFFDSIFPEKYVSPQGEIGGHFLYPSKDEALFTQKAQRIEKFKELGMPEILRKQEMFKSLGEKEQSEVLEKIKELEKIGASQIAEGLKIMENPGAEEGQETSAIVVIGAGIQNGKESVYWISPKDANDPKDPNSQRVFVSSFLVFRYLLDSVFPPGGVLRLLTAGGKERCIAAFYNPVHMKNP